MAYLIRGLESEFKSVMGCRAVKTKKFIWWKMSKMFVMPDNFLSRIAIERVVSSDYHICQMETNIMSVNFISLITSYLGLQEEP